jgi:hypothetical protein
MIQLMFPGIELLSCLQLELSYCLPPITHSDVTLAGGMADMRANADIPATKMPLFCENPLLTATAYTKTAAMYRSTNFSRKCRIASRLLRKDITIGSATIQSTTNSTGSTFMEAPRLQSFRRRSLHLITNYAQPSTLLVSQFGLLSHASVTKSLDSPRQRRKIEVPLTAAEGIVSQHNPR